MKRQYAEVPEAVVDFDYTTRVAMGARIRRRREQLGYSMSAVSRTIGYKNIAQLSKIELGDARCGVHQLYILSQVLQVSSDYLLFGDEHERMVSDIDEKLYTLNEDEVQWISDTIDQLLKAKEVFA